MKIETILDRKSEEVITIDISLNLEAAADLMMHHRIAALVVTEEDEPVALLSERDLVMALAWKGTDAARTPILDMLTGPMPAISPDASLKQAMAMMTRKRVRHLPVFQNRELIGIVSLGDLVKHRLEEMELETNVLRDLAIAAR